MRKLKIALFLARALAPESVQRLTYAGRFPVVDGRKIDPSAASVSDLVTLIRGTSAPPSLSESRRQLAAMAEKFDQPCPAEVKVTQTTLPGAQGPRPARVYEAAQCKGTVLYLHGGGWVQGSLDTHHGLCGKLALWAGVKVISYDYRLAPEAKFPAAPDDVLACYQSLLEQTPESQIVVAGDSAGANLTAALMHDLRAQNLPLPTGQVLLYPAVDARMQTRSMEALADQPLLPRSRMEFFIEHYLSPDQDRNDPRVSPLFSPYLSNQPTAFIVAGGHDPLWDDGLNYAQALNDAGTQVQLEKFEGQIHAFCSITKVIPQGNDALHRAADWIKERLNDQSEL